MSEEKRVIFEDIKDKYGDVASWAIWHAPGPEWHSNMEVDGLFDLNANPKVLNQLNPDVVMVGYNFSVTTKNPPTFHNFHTYYGAKVNQTTIRNAAKIRYAFTGTPYYGAYMTDIIKNYIEPDSNKVKPQDIKKNIKTFRDEIATLRTKKPLIIAFGHKAHKTLMDYLGEDDCYEIKQITHYSYFGPSCARPDDYRETVLRQLNNC